MYGESPSESQLAEIRQEPSPHVRGKYFPTRVNTRQSRELDSLSSPMRLDGTGILPDGNPPASPRKADLPGLDTTPKSNVRLDYSPLPSLIGEVSNAL